MSVTLPVTVIIPVRNEERMLPACLARLHRFSEIVVVDSASTDQTRDIARAAGATVLDFAWDGRFPKKRNWALMHHPISNPWVLFLDADEMITDDFCEALHHAVHSERFVGYWLHYTNHFLGHPLRHGVPQKKLALFKVGAGQYERIDEDRWSALDMEVHEHPIIDGPVGEIKARIEHRDDRGVLRFIDRHRDYAQWEAKRAQALLRLGLPNPNALTARQRLKYRSLQRWWFPWFYFTIQYFFKLGFLDGHAGLQYALLKFWYFSTVRLLILEHKALTQAAAPS